MYISLQQEHHPLCTTLLQLIEQFDQRMQLINGRGGSIATDRAILSMHQNLTALHLQLLQQIDEVHEEKGKWNVYIKLYYI